MSKQILTPEQIDSLKEVKSPLLRRRFTLYFQLPSDLKESMFAEGTADSVWSITKEKYNLADEGVTAVARAIGLIFLGELPVKNFVQELTKSLKVDIAKATSIAQDINQTIFQPVRESLMEIHGLADADQTRIPSVGTSESDAEVVKQKVESKEPISLNELEKRRTPIISEKKYAPPVNPKIFQQDSAQAERRRKELLSRLRQERGGTTVNLSKKTKSTPGKDPGQALNKRESNPTATTTAWNGRTIDLRNIPPRRSSPNKKYSRFEA